MPITEAKLPSSVANKPKNNYPLQNFGQFDFIVVGAGSAGAIVAKRLSENKFTTLLIEAGRNENNFTDIPGIYTLLEQSDYNWGYMTEPQKYYCQGMHNKQCSYPRGKSVGGSSSINAMVYSRGNSLDQDEWSQHGISGWSWKDVLPFYKKLESFQDIADKDYHGFNGPMPIEIDQGNSKLAKAFLGAFNSRGDVTDDYNGQKYFGASRMQYLTHRGKRVSTGKAYLSNTNSYLTILTEALAYKVVFDNDLKAQGVQFVYKDKNYRAIVSKDVILSGGSINTPQLLMLSGIGPKNHLEEHCIPVKLDLPVGQNLQDHVIFFGLTFETKTAISKQNYIQKNIEDYLNETGDLTKSASEGIAFIKTDESSKVPQVEILALQRTTSMPVMQNVFNLKSSLLPLIFQPKSPPSNTFGLLLVLLHSKSRGTIKLASNQPWDFVKIDPNQLSHPDDVETLYKATKYITTLIEESKHFQKLGTKFVQQTIPDCKHLEFGYEAYWHCMIRHLSHTLYHPIGTCRMGGQSTDSVVDSELKVLGTRNLRIVDASVIPVMPSGHTHALAMMIGEKVAEMIKEQYRK